MALNPQTINASFFAVLKADSAGTATRAALGNSASSVIPAESLKLALPTAPFIVFRANVITGNRYDVRTLFMSWWLYDDEAQRHYRINGLIPLIEAAYPRDAIQYCYTDVVSIGQEQTDSTLARPVRNIQFIVKTRR